MKNWKNTIIFDDKTIYDAIKNLEKTGLQIILVTNNGLINISNISNCNYIGRLQYVIYYDIQYKVTQPSQISEKLLFVLLNFLCFLPVSFIQYVKAVVLLLFSFSILSIFLCKPTGLNNNLTLRSATVLKRLKYNSITVQTVSKLCT